MRVLPLGARLSRDAAVLRLFYPFDGRPDARARRTAVFAVAGRLTAGGASMRPGREGERPSWPGLPGAGAVLEAPTAWAVEAFWRSGVARGAVAVAPHGVDVARFRPAAPGPQRNALWARLWGFNATASAWAAAAAGAAAGTKKKKAGKK